jgi:FAD/FMN-containing dehydrogenase
VEVPPAPDFPEEAHGRRVVIPAAVSIAPLDEAERAIAPLRSLGTPLADLSGPVPYTALQASFDGLFPAGIQRYYWKSLYLDGLGDDVIDALVPRGVERPSDSTIVAVWQLGGAMARVPSGASAFGRRDAPFMLTIDATWAEPGDDEVNIRWTRDLWRDMHAFSSGGVCFNFPGMGEEGEALVRAAYGDNHPRLAEVKRRYDPGNLFAGNMNIAAAS